jgi:spore coat protein CotH
MSTPHRWIPALASTLTLACGDPSTGSGESTEPAATTAAATTTATTDGSTSSDLPTTSGATTSSTTDDPTATTAELPPDLPSAPACEPDGGGPYWLLEGDAVSVPLGCKTGLQLAGEDFTIEPMPEGATYDPKTATLHWTPGLDQGAVYNLTITANGEFAGLKIGVVDRWNDPGNVPVVDPLIYTEEYGLPVLHLTAAPDINADASTPATAVYRGHTYTAGAKYRGAASLGYPKKSFTIEFSKDDKFNEPAYAGGFTDKRKLVLISTFDDNTYVRQRLAYEMWDRLDPGHLQIQVYSGVLFLNGVYWGLYTFSDHVDDDLMGAHGLSKAGNLYKARTHDANFRLVTAQDMKPKSSPHQGLTKEEGLPLDGQPGAYDDLDDLVTFVATATAKSFLAEIDTRIDRRDYEDWWIFVSLIMGDDSAGKNSYHYHDPIGGPWRFAPWDFNDSFGQTWQSARKGFEAHPDGYTWANQLFTRFLAEPSIGDPLRARYGAVLAGVYALDDILALYDAMIAEIDPSARRDEGLWGQQYINYGGWNWRKDFLTYEEEVLYMRQWMQDRWAFVDDIY